MRFDNQGRISPKICFLDIDGVLNSKFWNDSHQREISEGKYIDRDKVKLLGLLIHDTGAKLVLHSGWRFWFDDQLRPLRPEAAHLVHLLAEENMALYDRTPDLTTEEIRASKKFSLVKAREILAWLEAHPGVRAWVVLDDLDLYCRPPEFTVTQPEKCLAGGLQSGQTVNLTGCSINHNTVTFHQVRTNADTGLTIEDINAAKSFLNNQAGTLNIL